MNTQPKYDLNTPLCIDGGTFKQLIFAGLTWLRTNQENVNALNVFPVPDGDTGTNMVLTLQAAYDEIKDSDETNIGTLAHAVSQGALMGARGNSGVILSQLLRGFARACDKSETLDSNLLKASFIESKETAYKGVVRPVEGTILTVAKDTAAFVNEKVAIDTPVQEILETILSAAKASVTNTPNLLPILKQAGVVDSGGEGLFFILEGAAKWLCGEELDSPDVLIQPLANLEEMEETVEPGQDWEVVVDFRPQKGFNLRTYYDDLEKIGTSIQVGEGDNMIRMHIHVPHENRYEPIEHTMTLGTVTFVHIENLVDQLSKSHPDGTSKQPDLDFLPFEPGQIAVVAASPGPGISRIFASLGAAAIVNGGQTMNPSTEEILSAFRDLPTDKIVILPNNKNIILAAQAAASVSDKKVAVIPSKTIPEGISAILRLMPGMEFDAVIQDMIDACDEVESGQITMATRTVEINGVSVEEGQVIALHNGTLIRSCTNIEDAVYSLLDEVNMDERERVTFFYGSDITFDEVQLIVNGVEKKYPDHEFEIHNGGQPFYQFIISIE
jgi:DAK2 domain fusion protein YloV